MEELGDICSLLEPHVNLNDIPLADIDRAVDVLVSQRQTRVGWLTRAFREADHCIRSYSEATDADLGAEAQKAVTKAINMLESYYPTNVNYSLAINALHNSRYSRPGYKPNGDEVKTDEERKKLFEEYQSKMEQKYFDRKVPLEKLLDQITYVVSGKANQSVASDSDFEGFGGRQSVIKWKDMVMFRPKFALSTTISAIDFEKWVKVFTRYFNASKVINAEMDTQHGFIEGCVSAEMWYGVEDKIADTTPVLPAVPPSGNSIIEKLRVFYNEKNPISANRLDFFTKLQPENGSFLTYQAKKRELFERCDSANLYGERLLAYTTLMGITDRSLRKAILDEVKGEDGNVTMEIMTRVAKVQESIAQFDKLALGHAPDMAVCKVESGGSGKSAGKNGKNGKSGYVDFSKLSGNEKIKAMVDKGLCPNCMKKHGKDSCKVKEVECKKCKKKGHLEKCCASVSVNKISEGNGGGGLLEITHEGGAGSNPSAGASE